MGAWIHMVAVAEATGTLKAMYEKVKTPHGTVEVPFTQIFPYDFFNERFPITYFFYFY